MSSSIHTAAYVLEHVVLSTPGALESRDQGGLLVRVRLVRRLPPGHELLARQRVSHAAVVLVEVLDLSGASGEGSGGRKDAAWPAPTSWTSHLDLVHVLRHNDGPHVLGGALPLQQAHHVRLAHRLCEVPRRVASLRPVHGVRTRHSVRVRVKARHASGPRRRRSRGSGGEVTVRVHLAPSLVHARCWSRSRAPRRTAAP